MKGVSCTSFNSRFKTCHRAESGKEGEKKEQEESGMKKGFEKNEGLGQNVRTDF
jgi:hypothetical protein